MLHDTQITYPHNNEISMAHNPLDHSLTYIEIQIGKSFITSSLSMTRNQSWTG